jgi:hypothetical protein
MHALNHYERKKRLKFFKEDQIAESNSRLHKRKVEENREKYVKEAS